MHTGPRWHLGNCNLQVDGQDDSTPILRASRYFDQMRSKSEGNIVDRGLDCNLWKRASTRNQMHYLLDSKPNSRRDRKILLSTMSQSKNEAMHDLPGLIANFLFKLFFNIFHVLEFPVPNERNRKLTLHDVQQILKCVVNGEIEIFHRLRISHELFKGEQFVYSHPNFYGLKRTDTVFIVPIESNSNSAHDTGLNFVPSFDTCVYGRVERIFRFEAQFPAISEIFQCNCALINSLDTLQLSHFDDNPSDWFRDPFHQNLIGTRLLYQTLPPVSYVVPVSNILGRLPLVPAFEGKVPRYLEGRKLTRENVPTGQILRSELYFINSWAMIWPKDFSQEENLQETADY